MKKLLDRFIEWLVAIAVVYITTLNAFKALLNTFDMSAINGLMTYSSILMIGLLLLYQKRHYGLKVCDRPYLIFYLVYCLYIFLYMTLFRRYPLEDMTNVPESVFRFFYLLCLSLGYLLCAPTIYHHFNLKKFIFLSLLVCTIPSALFVQYVGVDLIQAGIGKDDDEYVPTLTITYSNVPLLVLAVINFKKLFDKKLVSIITSSAIIAAVVYVLLAYGKRGPMLWGIVSILGCFFISSGKLKKYFLMLGLAGITFLVFLDPIIEGLTEVLPKTGHRIEETIKNGDTDGRFDMSNPKHSTYLIGLENFSRSPVWGYYFRLVTDYRVLRGSYAHNIFIEVLMTMGILGFIPFMLLMLRAYNRCRNLFTKTHTVNQMSFFILFLCAFLHLQTSASIVFRHNFWLFFYMLCCIDVIDKIKEKIPVRYSHTRSLSLKQTT